MPGIAVRSLDSAGGTQLANTQNVWRVEGMPIVRLGDRVAGHGRSPHNSPTMVEGSDWFRFDGIPVCRAGHRASCGHASTGRPWFRHI